MDLDAVTCSTPRVVLNPLPPSAKQSRAVRSLEWEQTTDTVRIVVWCDAPGAPSAWTGVTSRISARRVTLSIEKIVLLSEVLAKEVNPEASTWTVEANRSVVLVLRKRRRREWLEPFAHAASSDTAQPPRPRNQARPSAPATASAAVASSASPAAFAPSPSSMSSSSAPGAMAATYSKWDRFDEIAALTQVENEDLPDEPGLRVEAGAGRAHIEYTDYEKSVEEVGLDEELKAKGEDLQRDVSQRLADAARCKKEANERFKSKDFAAAAQGYERALAVLGRVDMMLPIMGPRLRHRSSELLIQLHNNVAAACLQTGDAARVVSATDAALKLDDGNAKALYRRARGRGLLAADADAAARPALFAAARLDLETVLSRDAGNRAARNALSAIEQTEHILSGLSP